MKRILGIILALACVAGCTGKKESMEELVIGFNPAESVDVVDANSKVLAQIIEKELGLKLKTFVASDYGAMVEAMRSGRVHMAFLPPFSLVQAERIAGAKVLLKAVRRGQAFFYSAIITAKDFKSLKDLKGKTIAWTDPASSSGHIVPKSSLADIGIEADTFFSKQVFAGGHDALVLAVVNKTVDAGATFANGPNGEEGAWTQFIKDPEKVKQVRVLHVSKPIPGDTLSTTEKYYQANKAVVDKITALMQRLDKTDEGKKILKDLYRIDSLVPAKSEEYEPLRAAARRLKISG